MSKVPIKRIRYFKGKEHFINEDNWKKYTKYLQSNIIKNRDVKDTTYKRYEALFKHFLMWLGENYGDLDLYSDEFIENAVDIIENYMYFCQDTLGNHKKIINMKVSAISSFYIWSTKRGFISNHPFDGKLTRMTKADEEQILNHYFLDDKQIATIRKDLYDPDKDWSIQDKIFFEVALFSANRIGAIEKLTISHLNVDEMQFDDIREKEGYIVSVPISKQCIKLINEWIEMRRNDYDKLKLDDLFIHEYKGEWIAWSRDMFVRRVHKFGNLIGIDDLHVHCFRKTRLSQIYDITGDLNLASEWANHKSSQTTQKSYIKPKSKSSLRKKLQEMGDNI